MFERFSDRARNVMALANQEAQRFQHEYIGTEHLLLGLVKEGRGVGASVLKQLDVDLRRIRLEVEKLIRSGPEEGATAKLPQTPRVKKVIEYAIEEARMLGHSYVGTEHLLLGLLREQDGVAGQVLKNLGLKLESVRNEIKGLLGEGRDTQVLTDVTVDVRTARERIKGIVGTGDETEDEPSDSPRTSYEVASALAERFRDHPLVQHYQVLIEGLERRKDTYVHRGDYEAAAALRDQVEGVAGQLQQLCRLLEEDPNFGQ
jgi:hypothetical protein